MPSTCCEEGCKIIPTYNVEGQTKGLYCANHKKEGMINVKDKRCKWQTRISKNFLEKHKSLC